MYVLKNSISKLIQSKINLKHKLSNKTLFQALRDHHNNGIFINNVQKVYNKHVVVSTAEHHFQKNSITVLIGHNGAGKSTLMSMITGMIKATKGKIFVNGFDVQHERKEMLLKLGLCPQHNMLFTNLTVKEHLEFIAMVC